MLQLCHRILIVASRILSSHFEGRPLEWFTEYVQ